MIQAIAKPPSSGAVKIPFRWLAAATLVVSFFLTEHYLDFSLERAMDIFTDTMEEAVGSGMATRRIGFLLLGALGLYGLLRQEGRAWARLSPPMVLAGIFAIWTASSILWTTAPELTYRRLFVQLCCFLAMLGIARQTTPQDLARIALVAAGSFVALGLVFELAHGTFRPWEADYRFSGTQHPNSQATSCAFVCMAAVLLSSVHPRARRWLWLLALGAFALLWLTGSRTSTAAMLGSLLIVQWVRSRGRGLTLIVPWVVATGAAVLLASDWCGRDLVAKVTDVALMGRGGEDAAALAGRLPLWNELIPYIAQRPVLGYGYGAFWTVEHVNTLSTELAWAIGAAHNAFLELTLDLGLVGAVLATITVLMSVGHAGRLLRRGDSRYAFAFAVLLLAIFGSFTEAAFVTPCFGTAVVGCALCHVVFFTPPQSCSMMEITHA